MNVSSKRSIFIGDTMYQESSPERDVCVNGSLVTGSIKEVKLSIGGTSHDTTVDISSVSGGNGRYYVVTLAATAPASAVVGDALWDEAATPKKWQILYISGTTLWVRDAENNGTSPSAAGTSTAYIKRYYNSSTSISDWITDLTDTNVHPKSCLPIGEIYNDQVWSAAYLYQTTSMPRDVVLRAAVGEAHDGTEGTGVRIAYSSASRFFLNDKNTYGHISDIEIDYGGTLDAGTTGHGTLYCNGSGFFSRMIIHGVYNSAGAGSGGLRFNHYAVGHKGPGAINNCIFYDFISSPSFYGIYLFVSGTHIEVTNNTIYDFTHYGGGLYGVYGLYSYYNAGNVVAKNNIVVKQNETVLADSGCFLWRSGSSNIQPDYNLSSDGTADDANDIANVHWDDLFVSTTSGFEDLHLKEGAPAIGAGADLGVGEYDPHLDIHKSNRARFTATTWDIGAHQYEITASIGAGTGNNRDYEGSTAIADWVTDLDDTNIYGISGAIARASLYDDGDFVDQQINTSGIAGTTSLGGIVIQPASGEGHGGIAGGGVEFTLTTTLSGSMVVLTGAVDTSLIGLEFDGGDNSCFAGISMNATAHFIVDGNIVHNVVRNSSNDIEGISHTTNGHSTITNNFVYAVEQQNTGAGNVIGIYGITITTIGEGTHCSNNTIFGIKQTGSGATGNATGLSMPNDADIYLYNNLSLSPSVVGSGTAACYNTTFTAATAQSLYASDNTDSGTNSMGADDGIVASDEIVSTVAGFEDLHLKSGADSIGGGYDLGIDADAEQPQPYQRGEWDIDGNDRDWDGSPWDVGAHQFVPDNGATSADWTQKYNRKCALSIQSSQVAVDWEGYTVAITEDCLPEEMFDSDGSYPAQANGGDVRFSSDENGLFPLPAHIARFSTAADPTSGRALIFVNTDIDAGTDVDVYVWYNAIDTKTQPDVDHDYGKYKSYSSWLRAVYHFEDASVADAASIDEATGRFLSSDISGSGAASTTGPLGNELNLSGSQFVDVNGQVYSGYTTKLTLTSFFNSNDVTKVNSLFGYWLDTGATKRYKWYQDTNAKMKFTLSNDGGTPAIVAASTSLVDSTDYHLGVTFNQGTVTHYLNGSSDGSGSTDAYLVSVAGNDAIGWVNGNDATANKTDGNLDEFWAWERVLSANEMTTLYNNQSSPATFVIEGTPASVAPVSETPVACDGTSIITSSWSADLVELIALDGVSSVNSIWSADLVESIKLDGTAAIDSIWSGNLEETYNLDGSVSVSSLWSGDVLEKLALVGASSILSSWTGPSPATVSIGIIASHKHQATQQPIYSPVGYYRLGGSAVRNFRRQGYPQIKQQFMAFPLPPEEVAVAIDGTAAISSLWSSDLVESFSLSGVAVIASIWSSDLVEHIAMDGTAATLSLWSADVAESIKSEGTAGISSLWSAEVQETYNLDGTTTVTSLWAAGLTETYDLDGTAGISSLWSADVLEFIKIDGTSTISSDWFAGTVVSVALTGTSAIDSLWSSNVLEAIKLDGVSAVSSLWSADVLEAIKLDGVSAVSSLWSADVLEYFALTGTSVISSEWTAGTVLSVPLDGTSVILSSWSSDLVETFLVSGIANIQSTWTSDALESLSVQGTVGIQSAWSSDLEEVIGLNGNTAISSEWSSESVLPIALNGTSSILSLWESDFSSLFNLSGFVPIESVWSAGVFEAISLSGTADILSVWFASLEEIVAIQGTAAILSYWVYDTSAIYTAITVAAPCRQFSVEAPYRSFSVYAPRRMSSMSHYQCSVSMPPIVKQEWEEFNIGGDMTNWLSSDDTVASVDDVVIQDNDESSSLTVGTGFVSGLKGVKFGIAGGKSDRDYRVEVRFTTANGHKLAADFPINVRG